MKPARILAVAVMVPSTVALGTGLAVLGWLANRVVDVLTAERERRSVPKVVSVRGVVGPLGCDDGTVRDELLATLASNATRCADTP